MSSHPDQTPHNPVHGQSPAAPRELSRDASRPQPLRADPSVNHIHHLVVEVPPLSPRDSVSDVGDLFLTEDKQRLLSLPVVENGQPIGIISRYDLMRILMRLYGRELYGKRPIGELMKRTPLCVDVHQPMEAVSQYVTEHIQFPITEDFIIVEQGRYLGMGMVVDLLRAMEERVAQRNNELAHAYDSLKASQAQLVQSEKMASLGQMVAGVAHEINTPLGYVRNNVEVIRETLLGARDFVDDGRQLLELLADDDADETALSNLLMRQEQRIRELDPAHVFGDIDELCNDSLYGIEQIDELVRSLKDFSRVDQALVDDVAINSCIDNALTIGRNALKHKVEVIRQLGEVPTIRCAPSQINQVLLNLLTNAAQAIDDQGKILIKSWADDTHVYASVEDNGRGIPEEILPSIFDPFFTTKPLGQGTGLGLAISYQIIQRHGGSIRVNSRAGVGTKFLISLPRQDTALQMTG